MKKALILHGTENTSQDNWFPWLKEELETAEYKVWVPDLPGAEKPNIRRYNQFLFNNSDWQFDSNTTLIGHSSGAVAILGILQALPENLKVDTCVLVGAFKDNLNWEALEDLFLDPFDFQKIQQKAKRIVFIHSDDDPYCPLDHALFLREQLDAELHLFPGQKHFSVKTFGEEYRQFPILLDILKMQPYQGGK